MTVHVRTIALYLFCLMLSYLAAAYFGSVLLIIFYVLLLYPIVSAVVLIHWFINLDFYQSFRSYQAVRGQSVDYWLFLCNDGSLPITRVCVRFHSILSPLVSSLGTQERREHHFQVRFSHRGVYPVGVASVEISDFLHFFTLRKKTPSRYFSVYPRIYELNRFVVGMEDLRGWINARPEVDDSDRSFFGWLRDYREGEPIHSICWKKFAATGRPYLKEFEGAAGGVVHIYFDLRECLDSGIDNLSQQDGSLEILVAIVKYLLDRSITTLVTAPGNPPYQFVGAHRDSFRSFYLSTLSLSFHRAPSPAQLFRMDSVNMLSEYCTQIFIAHAFDEDLMSVIEGGQKSHAKMVLFMNHIGSPQEVRQFNQRRLSAISASQVPIIVVENQESLPQFLTGMKVADIHYAS